MQVRSFFVAILGILSLFSSIVLAAESKTFYRNEQAEVRLLYPKSVGAIQEHWAIEFDLKKDWHIYWINPGDSGASPKFQFQSNELKFGAVKWPVPHRIPLSHLVNYGYKDSVVFPFQVQTSGAENNQATIDLEWLVCKVECIPGFAKFHVEVPLSKMVDGRSEWDLKVKDKINQTVTLLPHENSHSVAVKSMNLKSGVLQVNLEWPTEFGEIEDVFPSNGEYFATQKPTFEKVSETLYRVSLVRQEGVSSETLMSPESSLGFINVVVKDKSFLVELTGKVSQSPEGAQNRSGMVSIPADQSYMIYLVFAFLGGVILNLMPCVFPVLSLKIFSFAKDHQSHLKEGLWYSLGVIGTFTLLGAILLLLKSLGTNVGWGFQLQHPLVVSVLVLLFFLMALNFFGFYEFGDSLMNLAAETDYKSRKWKGASFWTGVLAVFVAAPCTGPFMGSALGAASVLPPIPSMMIFVMLGAGLAFPFLVLAASPTLLKYLPKPGAWMETFKQFLGFPMLLTSVWLVWVLNSLLSPDAGVLIICLLVSVTFFIWWAQKIKNQKTKWFIHILNVFVLVWGFWTIYQMDLSFKGQSINRTSEQDPGHKLEPSIWQSFDPIKIEKDLLAGKSVFVDFTAKWCITCQVNKKNVLETDQITKYFQDHNVSVYRADWTKYDPVITEALSKVGRNSVPVYLFYKNGNLDPIILPQLLTSKDIETLF